MYVGIGVDVHPVEVGRECWIAGLQWPRVDGCAGHSDGDVVSHALCNVLLSAANIGDLGAVFGTDDPRWAGAHGLTLLAEVRRLLDDADLSLGNAVVQPVGNAPRLSTRRAEAERPFIRSDGRPGVGDRCHHRRAGLLGPGAGVAAFAVCVPVPAARA